jgi:hypothetical protein
MPFYVERTRTAERRDSLQIGARSTIGDVKYSATFATAPIAQAEADKWSVTGSWSCRVIEGRSPADPGRVAKR